MQIKYKRSLFLPVLMIILIIATVCTVIAAVIFRNLYTEQFFAQKRFEELSRDYYETIIYPNIAKNYEGDQLEEAFKDYVDRGETIRLRVLTNYYRIERKQDYRSDFKNDTYECNEDNSSAVVTPKAPFGKTDYDITFELNCETK